MRLEEAKRRLVEALYRAGEELQRNSNAIAPDEARRRFERLEIRLSLTTASTLVGHATHAAAIRRALAKVETLLPSRGRLAAASAAIRRLARAVDAALDVVALKLEEDEAPCPPRPPAMRRRVRAGQERPSE